MATEAQLVTRTLGLLRAVGSGQSPTVEDTAIVTAYLPEKFDDLAARAVIYIADTDSIPLGALQWLAMALAEDLAEDFGRPMDPGKVAFAEARLRELGAETPDERVWFTAY